MSSLARVVAIVFTVGLSVATVYPAFKTPATDDFPFSPLPMFSHPRKDARYNVYHILGVKQDNTRVPIEPLYTTGNSEVLQTHAVIRNAIGRGPKAAKRLCIKMLNRLGDDANAFIAYEVVTSHYDAVDYFVKGPTPLSRKVAARCWPSEGGKK